MLGACVRDTIRSPTDEFAVDEVPLEDIHVKDVQVERVGLDAVELAIGAYLGLPLVEVRLRACFAVQLLDIVRSSIEQVAMVRLLVTCSESTKDQDVLVGDLVESTAFQADPVCVFFDP